MWSCPSDGSEAVAVTAATRDHVTSLVRGSSSLMTATEETYDERPRLARSTVRGAAPAPAAGRLPDARLARRKRGRNPGGLAPAQPHRRGGDRQPRRGADPPRRGRLPRQSAG